ncbi:MAG: thioredoxin-disulfide reductase [Deltaproteobacteria bacterium]|nr:thioredoxin-disulfide reductase [Deltaproteobacteria bacterium]MBW2086823.1 thioredoxin-disulfide reductase [Deltaproteobacteria bacterium]
MSQPEYDLIIIGGGPAGLTAGIYASRARLKTRLIEKLSPGGQVLTTDWVENYPGFPEGVSGFDLMDKMRQQAERFGLEIASGEAASLKKNGELIQANLAEGEILSKTIIIATGVQPNKLGVPGEEELTGKGVSYCATCDGPFFKDVEVLVVGGGDTAVQEALFLTRFASRVHLCHRRDELRATGILRERVLAEPKIELHWSTVVTAIEADSQNQVEAAEIKDLKTGKTSRQPVQGVFMFVGIQPTTEFLKGFIELDERGFVKTDLEMAASQPGVWAVGDVRVKYLRQIATAIGDGATAAFNVEKYIEERFNTP